MRTGQHHQQTTSRNPLLWVVFFLLTPLRWIGRIPYRILFLIIKWSYQIIFEVLARYHQATRFPTASFSPLRFVQPLVIGLNIVISALFRALSLPFRLLPRLHAVWFWHWHLTLSLKQAFKKIYIFFIPLFLWQNRWQRRLRLLSVGTIFSRRLIRTVPKRRLSRKPLDSGWHFPSVWTVVRTAALMLLLSGLTSAGFLYYTILKDLPNPNILIERPQALTTKIFSRDGRLLYKIYRNQNRSLVKLEDIPKSLVDATIAIEDREFWSHPGFSVRGILRAFTHNFQDDSGLQGGSTITQQLVKNAILSSEQTVTRKLKELILAIEVELMFSKPEILQMYFNEIPYGGVAYGAEEASQTYFGKSVKDLNLAEAALLAGLPTAPTRFSPQGANPEYAVYRQRQVLERMVADGYITSDAMRKAEREKIILKPPQNPILAPHFVMYVKDRLVEKYGTRMVEEGGLEVMTSLDLGIQELAQQSVRDEIDTLRSIRVTNGAALVTHPQSGEILAMVGSRDYFDTEHDGNVNVSLQLRQPGSSIKPITYALALRAGQTPASMIEDTPVTYPDGTNWYRPVNYDGQYHGVVTLRTALGSSFNIPAVKLLNKYGVDNLINLAEAMGINTWKERNRFGLSLTLGGGEVRMVDLAVVYGVFANQGLRVDLNPILHVKTASGKVLEDFECVPNFQLLPKAIAADKTICNPKEVLSPVTAYQITDMLADNYARVPAFGPNSLLNIPGHQVAVKTGTTNDKRDNWAIGYTPEHVVAVWVGNNDNTPMDAVASGITGATPIWNDIMTGILNKSDKVMTFPTPSGLIPVEVCATNGLLPCRSCPTTRIQYFKPGTEPKVACRDGSSQPTYLTPPGYSPPPVVSPPPYQPPVTIRRRERN